MRFESAKRLDGKKNRSQPLRSQLRMWVEESLVFAESVGSCPFTLRWPLRCKRSFARRIEDRAITNREVSQPPAPERAERSPRDGVDVGAALRSSSASQESTSGCYCAICDGARQVAVAFGRFESDAECDGIERFLVLTEPHSAIGRLIPRVCCSSARGRIPYFPFYSHFRTPSPR
jgi:hypothetical protein